MSDKTDRWMLYGATGYSGRFILKEAKKRGYKPILAGRNRTALEKLGKELGFETRAFPLEDPKLVAEHLKDIHVVLHCASPFTLTSKIMVAGCVVAKTHYLDLDSEVDTPEYFYSNTSEYEQAGILVTPGAGYGVVTVDCLAAMLKRQLPDATHLRFTFASYPVQLGQGVAKTYVAAIGRGGRVRRDGKVVHVPSAYKFEKLPFSRDPEEGVAFPGGIVSSGYYSTGIDNIEIFVGLPGWQIRMIKMFRLFNPFLKFGLVQAFLQWLVTISLKDPSEEDIANGRTVLQGEATNASGQKAKLRMRTPDGYWVTVDAVLTAISMILKGNVPVGALPPSKAFGPEFALGLEGIECEAVE